MVTVVTNENLVDLAQGKQIPEFKPPESTEIKAEVKVDAALNEPAKTEPTDAKVEADKTAQPRGEDGKFAKAEDKPSSELKAEAKVDDPDDDVKLTRKIEKLINKKHRAMKEAEEFGASEARRAIAAEQRAEALQREIDALKGTKSDGASTAKGEPKPEDFKTVGEYTRALVKYEAEQAGKKGQQNAVQERQQAHANQIISEFGKRQADFMKATPDYEEVLSDCDVDVPPLAQQYLVESEFGPQLAYHLAKNPDDITRLQKLSPARQLAELGKLEARFEKPADAPNKAAAGSQNGVSRAPAPIQPLEAKTTPVVKDPSQMSFQELRAHREAERRQKRA